MRDRLYRQWLKDHGPGEVPRGLSERERQKYLKYQWARQNLETVTRAFKEEKRRILDDYMTLDPENIVLCTRCHYAREKGLLICPVCKTGYRKPRNPTCNKCRPTIKTRPA